MKTFSQIAGNEKYFKVVAANQIGGSEANYVIGELPEPTSTSGGAVSYVKAISKALNTLATRAFDYVVIVNRNSNIIVPSDSASFQTANDQAIVVNPKLDNAAKQVLLNNYLEILKDVTSDTKAVKVKPVVIPGEPIVIPKDTFAANFKSITQFTEGDKALLSSSGMITTFKHLTDDSRDLLAAYLNASYELLNEEDVGSWLNMPYFGGNQTDRYALYDGEVLTPDLFVKWVNKFSVESLDQIDLKFIKKL